MTRTIAALLCLAASAGAWSAPLLLRNPALSQDRIAFLYANDVWTVSRAGGEARRLTSVGNVSEGPYFSADGTRVAYSATTHGLVDVYVVDAQGGIPRRLTWDPMGNHVVGWTPDGKEVLFASKRASFSDFPRLFRVHADGRGPPAVLPLPAAAQGAYSADGAILAYVPVAQWQAAWKRYRGGQTTPIWLADMKTLEVEKVPRQDSNDSSPAWADGMLYFLSDRSGATSLFRFDPTTKEVTEVVANHGFDFKTVNAGPGALVYEQFGSIHLYDLASREEHTVPITIGGSLSELTPHLAQVPPTAALNYALSPTGARVAVEARGDIFTVPAEKGDTRNLTATPGVAERDPAWSPDGRSIAYFSDASGGYQLYIRDQDGLKPPRVIDLGAEPSFFYAPHWSPDSKRIAYQDKHLRFWYVDAAGGKPVLIDSGIRGGFELNPQIAWSPDSQWIAYARDLESQIHAVFLYSLTTHAATQLTDGMSDAGFPVFDPSGKYLYFLASTDSGPSAAGIDLSSLDRATSSSVYVAVLARDGASPVPPESDEEKAVNAAKAAAAEQKGGEEAKKKPEKPRATVVDLPGIGNRILALPIPARNYVDLTVGKTGVLLLSEGPAVGRTSHDEGSPPPHALWRFTLEKRQTEELLREVKVQRVSGDGEKLFFVREDKWFIAPIAELKPGQTDAPAAAKAVNNAALLAVSDPRAQWRQMFRETWRIERDFFYDPHLHGLDLQKVMAKYEPYLEGMASRDEFTYLSTEMLGELQVGHVFVSGPKDEEKVPKPGLLGADYLIEGDRYKFAKIYNGQNWTPALAAPLTAPGINVSQGDFLLAVNGRQLHATDNLDSFFDGTADKQTSLRVGRKADGSDARDVIVVPVASEAGLRNLDWIDANRRKVDALSAGKVAYIYMPNTAGAGYINFNRHFYSQLDKSAVVLDERYNEGGYIADYVINALAQQRLSGAIERDGKPSQDPVGAIYGPKAMIINQSAGSGGDAMPWYFRKAGLGQLVGTRTWGGLVGIGGYPELIDGGSVTAPRYAIYGLNGDWEVEGHGIAPDVVVEELPADVAHGHDMQLERAVALVLEQLRAHPPTIPPVPPYPNYHVQDGLGSR
jgi:tricorn protease